MVDLNESTAPFCEAVFATSLHTCFLLFNSASYIRLLLQIMLVLIYGLYMII